MHVSSVAPPCLLAVLVTGVIAARQLHPLGTTMMVVRTDGHGPAGGLAVAARADAAYVATPAPGYALLFGDAAAIRSASAVSAAWSGPAGCAAPNGEAAR